ncbi:MULTISPECIES: dihydrodipicolinate synthase family protein [Thermomonosporaceae]|uniref:dihydrodipicolinate synthase family protein n=1 Tax=Thermomonosporaceae TaxID=2012 RepID=UPI00255B1175|nr:MULTISPECIES: dihydrodipicolinate synthase family protein [Thermomonosporaceae]MDL4771058.1 dihydrodipicolinate synthase family protein [Actinomadura xylanilytica]
MDVTGLLHGGLAIPAHPLALDERLGLDEARQRALTRYYLGAGAGGLAVGVHTTQFAIHDPAVGLYEPVLALAAEELDRADRDIVRIAGILGPTDRAVREAEIAAGLGYHLGLVSMAAWGDAAEDEILAGVAAVGEILPVFGFYLQPAVGGRIFSRGFWRRFFEIGTVRAVKVAPFDRYKTQDVVHALVAAGRDGDVALYTGNDDNIVADLVTPFRVRTAGGVRTVRCAGGLLGQFAVWTAAAVELVRRTGEIARSGAPVPAELLGVGADLTDANAAVFDAANGFHGCVPGIHEVLIREGVMAHRRCLDPDEDVSPGQEAEIDRVWRAYPHLRDPRALAELLDGADDGDGAARVPHVPQAEVG